MSRIGQSPISRRSRKPAAPVCALRTAPWSRPPNERFPAAAGKRGRRDIGLRPRPAPCTCVGPAPPGSDSAYYAPRRSATASSRVRSSASSPARSSSDGSSSRLVEPEHPLEERRRSIAHRSAVAVAAGLCDEPTVDEARNGGVRRDAADAGDLGPADRAEIGDDRECLQRRLRQAALRGALDETGARLGGVPRGAKRIAACDPLEHDPAPALAIATGEQPDRGLDPLLLFVSRAAQLLDRERLRRDDEQRLDDPGETIDGVVDEVELTLGAHLRALTEHERLTGHGPIPSGTRSPLLPRDPIGRVGTRPVRFLRPRR